MTQPIRFFFDECLSRPAVETQIAGMLSIYGANVVVAHLCTKYSSGIKDRVYIPALAKEGGWIIITSDRGSHSIASDKLPLICQAFRVTHVMLSPGLAKRTMYYRTMAIQHCLPDLIACGSAPPGTGYLLCMRPSGNSFTFHLEQRTEAFDQSSAHRIQKNFIDDWTS